MTSNDNENSNNKQVNKKKWLALTAVGVALLLIPRRSSRQDADVGIDVSTDTTKDTEANKELNKNELTDTDNRKDS